MAHSGNIRVLGLASSSQVTDEMPAMLASSLPLTSSRTTCYLFAEPSDVASQSLRDRWHQLILRPLSKLDGHGCQSLHVLIVDALDECYDNSNVRIILQLLTEARSLEKVWLRASFGSALDSLIDFGVCGECDTFASLIRVQS